MAVGIIALILIWLLNSLKKEEKKKRKKYPVMPLVFLGLYGVTGLVLLFLQNDYGYFFVVMSLLICSVLEKESAGMIISALSMFLGVLMIKTNIVVGSLLIFIALLFWIYVWLKPLLKNKDKKTKIKTIIPIVASVILVALGLVITSYSTLEKNDESNSCIRVKHK